MGQIKRVLYDLVEFVVSSLSEGYDLEEIDELVENAFPEQYEFYLANKQFIMEEADTRIDDDNFNRVEEPDGQEGVYIGRGQYRPYTKDEKPDEEEDHEDWVDPAGGTHRWDDDDPASMYEARTLNTGWHFSQMSKGKKVKYKGKVVTLTSVGSDSAFAKDAAGKQVEIKSIKEISPVNERLVDDSDNRERSIDLRGPEGNAFAILGIAKDFTRQLKEADPKKYNWERIQSEMTSSDYKNLVHTFEKYFGDFITIYGADVLHESFDDNTHPGIDRYLDSNYQDRKYVSDSLRYNENPIDDFKLYFREHYPHISCNLSNREVSAFLTANHIMALPIEQKADLFSDYLMSQGLCDVDESLNEAKVRQYDSNYFRTHRGETGTILNNGNRIPVRVESYSNTGHGKIDGANMVFFIRTDKNRGFHYRIKTIQNRDYIPDEIGVNEGYMSPGHRVKFTHLEDDLQGYEGTIISCDGNFAKIETGDGDIVVRNVSSLVDLDLNESLDECCGGGIIKRPRPVRRPTSTNLPPKPRRLHESDYVMGNLLD